MSESLIKADTALESLRSSDFDTYSAFGEVIDNSVQANAKNIWIYLQEKIDRNSSRRSQIGQATFIDDGHGMSHSELHKCLKLGHSSRYNDRRGIGRFGVGMTLGAIHEARRIEVYSKQEEGNWQWTYIDLDEIKGKDDATIPPPINKTPAISGNVNLNQIKSGTVVVWKNYDKAVDDYEKILKESKFYLGRTFRKFIQGRAKDYKGELAINLNDEKIYAWDPLFHYQKNIRFSNLAEQSELLPPQILSIPITEQGMDNSASKVELNVSKYADVVKQKRGLGDSTYARERFIDRNEGVSILRNDREVFFGNIPYSNFYPEKDRNITRYVGIEISFSAELDQEFSVKNIKRGAVPVREMKKKLEDKLSPTIQQCVREVRMYWNKLVEEEERAAETTIDVSLPNSADVDTMKKVAKLKEKGAIDVDSNSGLNSPDNQRISDMLGNQDLEALQVALNKFGVVVDKRQWPGNVFFDVIHGNGAKLLAYNTNSLVYQSFNSALRQVRTSDSELATETKVIFDLIFVAMALAEGAFSGSKEMTWERAMKNFRIKWSENLDEIFSNID